MITLTRLTGTPFALNPDLVERVDCTPDTIITLVDGTKYLVSETIDEVVDAVLAYRAQIIAVASAYERTGSSGVRRNRLSAVPQDDAYDVRDHHGPPSHDALTVVSLEPRTI